ncbi:MAG: hypothetical protein QXG86_00195 [Candidatus Woesearchaeota archaeon]
MKEIIDKKIIYLIIIAAAVLAVPFVYRNLFFEKTIPGQEAYYYLKNINSKNDSNSQFWAYDYLLMIFLRAGIDIRIGSLIIGVLSCLFFYLLLRKIGFDDKTAFYSSLIFILSPTFIYLFSTATSDILSLFLIILGCYLLVNEKTFYYSFLSFLFSIKDFITAILILIILFSFFIWQKKRLYEIVIVSILIFSFSFFVEKNFNSHYAINNLNILSQLFSDIGGLYGVSIFSSVFALMGFFNVRKKLYLYPLIIFFIVSSFVNYRTIIYANVLLSALGGFGVESIIEKKWKLSTLKDIMIFIIICGILLSALSHIKLVSNEKPSIEIIKACEWLKNQSINGVNVLSSEDNAYFIEYFANKNAVFKPYYAKDKNFKNISLDMKEIFLSRRMNSTESLLQKYEIGYILIDDDMLKKIWQEPDEGLLFLLENKKKFSLVYNESGVKIWRYKYK